MNFNENYGKISRSQKENIINEIIMNKELHSNQCIADNLINEQRYENFNKKNLTPEFPNRNKKIIDAQNERKETLNLIYDLNNKNSENSDLNNKMKNINSQPSNNINNNSLNFQMNFLINNTQTPKLNFPQTTKFNNLLDKEGFKHIMDMKYAKSKINAKNYKRDQSSTKINTHSNYNPSLIISNKSEKGGLKYENIDNEMKNNPKHLFQSTKSKYFSENKKVASSNDSKNLAKSYDKSINLNSSAKDTLDYLNEYEDKLKEHLKKNLKDKIQDDGKLEEILKEMQNFSRKEFLKIPIKHKNDSSIYNSVSKNTQNINSLQSELSSSNNLNNNKDILDSCKNYYKSENNPSNFIKSSKPNQIETKNNITHLNELNNLGMNKNEIDNNSRNHFQTRESLLGNKFNSDNNINSTLSNYTKEITTQPNSKHTIDFEKERTNKYNDYFYNEKKNILINEQNKKVNFSNLTKKPNNNNKCDPFINSPKRGDKNDNYGNSLFSKFNNYKPRKIKNINNYFTSNSKNETNSNSIQLSGLSNAFKTFINPNSFKFGENKISKNFDYNKIVNHAKPKQNLIKQISINKLNEKTKYFNLNNSAGKIKITTKKLKGETSIMDKISDKLKNDFLNSKNKVDVITKIPVNKNNRNLNYIYETMKVDNYRVNNSIENFNSINEKKNTNNLKNEKKPDYIKYSDSDVNDFNKKDQSCISKELINFRNFDKIYLNNIIKNNKNSRNHKDIFVLDQIDSNKHEYSNDTSSQITNQNFTNKTQSIKFKSYSKNKIDVKNKNNNQNFQKSNSIDISEKSNKADEAEINNQKYKIDNFNCNITNNYTNFIANNKLFKYIQANKPEILNSKSKEKNNLKLNGIKGVDHFNKVEFHPMKIPGINKKNVNYDSILNKDISSRYRKNSQYSNILRLNKVRSYSPKLAKNAKNNKNDLSEKPSIHELKFFELRNPSWLNLKQKCISLSNKKEKYNKNNFYLNLLEKINHGKVSANDHKYDKIKTSSRSKNKEKNSYSYVESNRTKFSNKNPVKYPNSKDSIEEDKISLKINANENYQKKKKIDPLNNNENARRYSNKINILDSEEFKIEKNALCNKILENSEKSIKADTNLENKENIEYKHFITDICEDFGSEEKKISKKSTIDNYINSNFQSYKKNKSNLKNGVKNNEKYNQAFSTVEEYKKIKNNILQKNNTKSILNYNTKNLNINSSIEKSIKLKPQDIIKKYNLKKDAQSNIDNKSKSLNKNIISKCFKTAETIKNVNDIFPQKSINYEKKNNYADYAKKTLNKNNSSNITHKNINKENPKKLIDYINTKSTIMDDKKLNKENKDKTFFNDINKNNNLDYDLMNKIINSLDDEYKGLFNFSYDNVINKEKSENESMLSNIIDDL